MKGIKVVAIVLMLLASLFLMEGSSGAQWEPVPYEGCYMTGGGSLWGKFPPTNKTMFVNYGLLLTCPGSNKLPIDDLEPTGTIQAEQADINILSVAWSYNNRFVMKHLVTAACTGGFSLGKKVGFLPLAFNTIEGEGTGVYNFVRAGYKIWFRIIDNSGLGLRDWAHIVIKDAADKTVLDAQGYVTAGGQAAHCPMPE